MGYLIKINDYKDYQAKKDLLTKEVKDDIYEFEITKELDGLKEGYYLYIEDFELFNKIDEILNPEITNKIKKDYEKFNKNKGKLNEDELKDMYNTIAIHSQNSNNVEQLYSPVLENGSDVLYNIIRGDKSNYGKLVYVFK